MRSYGPGVHQAVGSVVHQSTKTFIRTDKAINSRMLSDFATLMEGYVEGLWILFVRER